MSIAEWPTKEEIERSWAYDTIAGEIDAGAASGYASAHLDEYSDFTYLARVTGL